MTHFETQEYELGALLSYEQPTKYIVDSTEYNDEFKTPVITAGKTFILGYTDENEGIFSKLPVIVFDDFTTATQYVDFSFKVKSSAMKILHINKNLVLPKYIYHLMQQIQFDASTHKRYWIQHYSKIKVSIPSLPMQEAIIAKIEELFSELDKAADTLRTILQQVAMYRLSVLREAFNRIEDSPTYLGAKRIQEFADVQTGATPKKSIKAYYGGDIPWVTSGALNNDFVNVPTDYITELALAETNCKVFQKHSLLIAMYGEGKTRGMCSELLIEAATNQAIAAITINSDDWNRSYLKWYLKYNYDVIRAKSSGGVQPNLNLSIIRNYKVPYCSFDKQTEVVEEIESRLSVCDNIERTVTITLEQTAALRQSILKQAFEGKLNP